MARKGQPTLRVPTVATIAGERAPDWSSEQWQDAGSRLRSTSSSRQAGRRITGACESPGSVRGPQLVWRVPTDGGPVWFKANNQGTVHEAVLIATLAELTPDRVLTPIAVDPQQGWSLLPDGGESLRDVLGRDPDLAHSERHCPGTPAATPARHRATRRRAGRPRGAGPPPRGAGPGCPRTCWKTVSRCGIGAEDGLDPETYERLRAEVPAYAERCRRLADLGIASTIQHDDLHDGNVFAGPDGYGYFDWGDASVAHPFGTLLVTVRSIRYARRTG